MHSRPEIDALDDLLLAPEQHLHDVSLERERRRSQQGYATPADARAFLKMARQPIHTIKAIATAYFRAADEEHAIDVSAPDLAWAEGGPARDADVPTSIDTVIELLTEAGMMPAQPRAGVPCEHAPGWMLGSVAALHAAGSVGCNRAHLQPGSGVLRGYSEASRRVPRDHDLVTRFEADFVDALRGR
ncbi:MAG: hypothetical protein ABI024_02470 [Vicinamibacterales bacterium]